MQPLEPLAETQDLPDTLSKYPDGAFVVKAGPGVLMEIGVWTTSNGTSLKAAEDKLAPGLAPPKVKLPLRAWATREGSLKGAVLLSSLAYRDSVIGNCDRGL